SQTIPCMRVIPGLPTVDDGSTVPGRLFIGGAHQRKMLAGGLLSLSQETGIRRQTKGSVPQRTLGFFQMPKNIHAVRTNGPETRSTRGDTGGAIASAEERSLRTRPGCMQESRQPSSWRVHPLVEREKRRGAPD